MIQRSGTFLYEEDEMCSPFHPPQSPSAEDIFEETFEEDDDEEEASILSSSSTSMLLMVGQSLGSSKPLTSSLQHPCNEDRILLATLPDHNLLLAGIFDGHGGRGNCSLFVANAFVPQLIVSLEEDNNVSNHHSWEKALANTFLQVDHQFRVKVESQPEFQFPKRNIQCCPFFNENPCMCANPRIAANEGSTGTVVLVHEEHIYCANVGDSDAFVFFQSSCRKRKRVRLANSDRKDFLQLNHTDTPIWGDEAHNEDCRRIASIAKRRNLSSSTELQRQRILPANGITQDSRGQGFNYVAIAGARSLNMTRAFGNLGNKAETEEESPIICRPHVSCIERTDSMHCIVMGSDGLWDNVSPAQVAALLHTWGPLNEEDEETNSNSCKRFSDHLLQLALRGKKRDDVSVVVIPL